MRPVIEKKHFEVRHAFYILIIIMCIIAIGVAVYMQFFRDEKLGVIFGITDQKEDEEYKKLKENFLNIFTNDISVINEFSGNINKIRKDDEIIVIAYDKKEETENYTLDLKIPYLNIQNEIARTINREIKSTFQDKSESVKTSKNTDNIIYNVRFKTYINNNILSLAIISELKEGTHSERIILQTYNYDLQENKQIKIDSILNQKNIDISSANSKIKEEVNSSQEQNIKLAELGYDINIRDVNSDTYKIQNAEQFLLGENGYLYIVYPYGNTEFTSEMDVIIFK